MQTQLSNNIRENANGILYYIKGCLPRAFCVAGMPSIVSSPSPHPSTVLTFIVPSILFASVLSQTQSPAHFHAPEHVFVAVAWATGPWLSQNEASAWRQPAQATLDHQAQRGTYTARVLMVLAAVAEGRSLNFTLVLSWTPISLYL